MLLILAFPDFEWWFFAWFALLPLMWAVEREAERGHSCPHEPAGRTDPDVSSHSNASGSRAKVCCRSFILGWLFGTAFFFGTCWWLAYAPIHYAAIPWPLAYVLIFIPCVISGIFPGIFAAILAVLLRRFGSWAFLAAPFVWVFTEFARYWLTGNNWNAIGYSQAFSWFAESFRLDAQVGGVYLVGFALTAFNAMIANGITAIHQATKVKEPKTDSSDSAHTFSLTILDEPDWDSDWPSSTTQDVNLALLGYIFPVMAVIILIPYFLQSYVYNLQRATRSKVLLGIALFAPMALAIFVWTVGMRPAWSFGAFSSGDTFVTAVQPNVPMSAIDSTALASLRDKQVGLAQSAFKENLERFVQSDFGIIDNIADEEDADFARYRYAKSPRVVILPESPMNFMYNDDREFQQFVRDFTTRNNVSLLFNSAEPDATNGKYFNSAVMVGPDGNEIAQYDKIYLLPFGEAVPVPLESLVPAFVGNFSYGREYDLLPLGGAKAGVMICFESHFGQLSREYVSNGADAIIEMTNDGYLGPTPVLRQHLANAVFRAVETNRPVLRVTNVGITAYIDERGQVHDPLPSYTEGTRAWTVSKSDGSQTFYVKYGDWFAWLCTVVTIALIGFTLRRRPEVAKARA